MNDKKTNLTVEEFLRLLDKISKKKKFRIHTSIINDLDRDRSADLKIEIKSFEGKKGLFISKIK